MQEGQQAVVKVKAQVKAQAEGRHHEMLSRENLVSDGMGDGRERGVQDGRHVEPWEK